MNQAPRRYEQLLTLIRFTKPATIVEVGTHRAERAVLMLREALRHRHRVHYIGFDVFEAGDAKARAEELQGKAQVASEAIARARLDYLAKEAAAEGKAAGLDVALTYELRVGETAKTLHGQKVAADFAFIDGGHRVQTIALDLEALRDCPVIALDDYYLPDREHRMPDTEWFGCNRIAEREGAILLPASDPINVGGMTAMALLHTPPEDKRA